MAHLHVHTRKGYQRLPRTIVITILVLFLSVTVAFYLMRMKARQTAYLGLAARYADLAGRYSQRSQSDSSVAQLFAEDVPNLEKLARTAVADGEAQEAATLQSMVTQKRNESERLKAEARRWTEVSRYYTLMQKRYAYGAKCPWWPVSPPSGDPLDVEAVFLSDDSLAER